MFEQITALHQQVREFVEKEEPNYSVTSITEYSETTYTIRDIPRYLLTKRTAHFSVQMIHTATNRYTLSLDVEVAEVLGGNGQLFIAKRPQVGRVEKEREEKSNNV